MRLFDRSRILYGRKDGNIACNFNENKVLTTKTQFTTGIYYIALSSVIYNNRILNEWLEEPKVFLRL